MSKSKKLQIIISIIAISFLQGLQYSVSPVLDQIQKHFSSVSVSLTQMLITAPSIIAMIFALISGVLVTKVSKKKLLVFASLVSGVVGFLPFLYDSFGLLMFSRTAYGIGLGLATALNTAVVAEFFEGDERVQVMGIQAASVGAGITIVTTVGGFLGANNFQTSYWINLLAFICMAALMICLPDTGVAGTAEKSSEKIELTPGVFRVAVLGAVEFAFLITFTTNIAMHLQGDLAGSTSAAGSITGVFSGSQIVIGFLLGAVTKVTKKYTLPAAMISFAIGALLLVLFPANMAILMVAAAFCGFSQGIFIPTAMVKVSNAVKPIATAMASAVFTCGMCLGQFVSPAINNTISKVIFGEVNTTNVYTIAGIGMVIAAVVASVYITTQKEN